MTCIEYVCCIQFTKKMIFGNNGKIHISIHFSRHPPTTIISCSTLQVFSLLKSPFVSRSSKSLFASQRQNCSASFNDFTSGVFNAFLNNAFEDLLYSDVILFVDHINLEYDKYLSVPTLLVNKSSFAPSFITLVTVLSFSGNSQKVQLV